MGPLAFERTARDAPPTHGCAAPNYAKKRSRLWRARYLLGLFAFLPSLAGQGAAQSGSQPTQTEVQAAYLYNFGKFVTWPASANAPEMDICILGRDPFGVVLDRILAHEKIDGRALAVVRLANIQSAKSCSILFFADSEATHVEQDLSAIGGAPVLTVSELPGFASRGGMIQFVLDHDRVRFEVNLNAARKSGLTLSSQLLKVALEVVGGPGRTAR